MTDEQLRLLQNQILRIMELYEREHEEQDNERPQQNANQNSQRQHVIAIPLSSLVSPLNEGFFLLLENVPFVALLVIMAVSYRFKWIVSYILLWSTLEFITEDFCREFSLKDTINRKKLLGYLCLCSLAQFISAVLLRGDRSVGSPFYASLSTQTTISGIFLAYLICDPALQLFFLQLKLCVGLLPLKLGSITKDYFYEKKRKMLAVIEELSVISRQFFVSLVWIRYYMGTKRSMLAEIFVLTYFSMKLQVFWRHLAKLYGMLLSLIHSNLMYGKIVSMQEAAQNGNAVCPICMDTITRPTKLSCNHIFCEPCIAQWLETNQTCPICRTTLENNGYWIHANGSRTRFPFFLCSFCNKHTTQ